MTNGRRLINSNIYDLLMRMNKKLNPVIAGNPCILECLCGDKVDVPSRCTRYRYCEECIQTWLNEEEK